MNQMEILSPSQKITREDGSSYAIPAIGKCRCGAQVSLEGFTNTCEHCQADYNSFGQRLGPRSQWGEETGESLADILRIR